MPAQPRRCVEWGGDFYMFINNYKKKNSLGVGSASWCGHLQMFNSTTSFFIFSMTCSTMMTIISSFLSLSFLFFRMPSLTRVEMFLRMLTSSCSFISLSFLSFSKVSFSSFIYSMNWL